MTVQVCGKRGHCAGFVGSVYHDCPFKPCYLCKQSGHTTMTCPFRIAPEHGCRQASGLCSDSLLACIRSRERDGRYMQPSAAICVYQHLSHVAGDHCTALAKQQI